MLEKTLKDTAMPHHPNLRIVLTLVFVTQVIALILLLSEQWMVVSMIMGRTGLAAMTLTFAYMHWSKHRWYGYFFVFMSVFFIGTLFFSLSQM